MKKIKSIGLTAFLVASMNQIISAQIGRPFLHDPSTVVEDNGKFYSFGTGSGGVMSNDGWTYTGGAVRPGGGAAPDAMKIGDRFLVVYGTTGGGGNHKGAIMSMWYNTLDPRSEERRVVK